MKINRIILENFKCFENEEFELSSPYTLIIGDNGKGKTAILDAIAVGISALLSAFDQTGSSRLFTEDDVRLARFQIGELSTVEFQYPTSVTCEGIFQKQKLTWTQSLAGKNKKIKTDKTIDNISQEVKQKVSNGENIILPLVVYYGTDRLWIPNQNDNNQSGSKGYENCFHPDSNITWLIKWLKQEKMKAVRSEKRSDALEVVTSAIAECMQDEDWQTITYDSVKSEVLAEAKDGRLLPLRLLSAGQRNMLAMVADMAYRAAMLNPHLGKDAAKETPGIVLIDEIDLHLHPTWQRGVVEALHRTFPNIQFIATTHSPFIIQSISSQLAKLINLDSQEITEYDYYKNSIEEISDDVMGIDVPHKGKRYEKMQQDAELYLSLIENAKNAQNVPREFIKEIEDKLDKLKTQLEMRYNDPAFNATLRIERNAAKIGKGVTK